jgi:hypothetical protein
VVNNIYQQAGPNHKIVLDAYNSIGRSGFGSSIETIDEAGFNLWLDYLNSGAVSPEEFESVFREEAKRYANEYPDLAYNQYTSKYL